MRPHSWTDTKARDIVISLQEIVMSLHALNHKTLHWHRAPTISLVKRKYVVRIARNPFVYIYFLPELACGKI